MVVFSEIDGMKQLNDGKPRKIKKCRMYSFVLDEDTTNYGTYEKGGIVRKVNQPKVLNIRNLQETINDPKEFLFSDSTNKPPRSSSCVASGFQSLDEYESEMGGLLFPGSETDADKFVSIANAINETFSVEWKLKDINPKLLRHFDSGVRTLLSPMASLFGGIAAQEIVKAISGIYHPIFQVLSHIPFLSFLV